jgi:hypothetical protein
MHVGNMLLIAGDNQVLFNKTKEVFSFVCTAERSLSYFMLEHDSKVENQKTKVSGCCSAAFFGDVPRSRYVRLSRTSPS